MSGPLLTFAEAADRNLFQLPDTPSAVISGRPMVGLGDQFDMDAAQMT
ncbi:hypothetical protein ACFO1B_36995 [Dactylosporangium siamense]|nr:hypothetical protein [Dactylosporangium siamense]